MEINDNNTEDSIISGADAADSLVEEEADESSAEDVETQETTGDEAAGETEAEVEDTPEKEIEELKAKLKESEDQFKRLSADFENFRRRSIKEKSELGDVVTQNILRDMLPLVDNFERAMATDNSDGEGFRKGMEMIFNQFNETLKKAGLEVIDTQGAKFDPNFHQAVMRIEDPEEEDDTIKQELAKGYVVKGRVIRPSMVQVVANL